MSSTDESRQPAILHINPDDPDKSLRGRVHYIRAVSQYAVGFWESLRDDVLYSCELFELRAANQPIPDGMQEWLQALFDHWLWAWEIQDAWLMDTCRHTLDAWAILVHDGGREVLANRHPLPVWYGPNESNLVAALVDFAPVFDQPYPTPVRPLSPEDRDSLLAEPLNLRIYEATVERESAMQFKNRMQAQFNAQLAKYLARCEARILEYRTIRRDAAWTALFQYGQTPKQIEAWETKRTGDGFSHARIQQVVKQFANSIGLTLRKPKAGTKSKRGPVRPRDTREA